MGQAIGGFRDRAQGMSKGKMGQAIGGFWDRSQGMCIPRLIYWNFVKDKFLKRSLCYF